jgi:hypothetical protein
VIRNEEMRFSSRLRNILAAREISKEDDMIAISCVVATYACLTFCFVGLLVLMDIGHRNGYYNLFGLRRSEYTVTEVPSLWMDSFTPIRFPKHKRRRMSAAA